MKQCIIVLIRHHPGTLCKSRCPCIQLIDAALHRRADIEFCHIIFNNLDSLTDHYLFTGSSDTCDWFFGRSCIIHSGYYSCNSCWQYICFVSIRGKSFLPIFRSCIYFVFSIKICYSAACCKRNRCTGTHCNQYQTPRRIAGLFWLFFLNFHTYHSLSFFNYRFLWL